MKLDMTLARQVLLAVEDRDDGSDEHMELDLKGYSYAAINYHCRLLAEAGLIDTVELSDTEDDGLLHYLPTRLTWNGHQFLASIRDDSVWKEVSQRLSKVGGSAVLEVVKALAVEVSKSLLRLP